MPDIADLRGLRRRALRSSRDIESCLRVTSHGEIHAEFANVILWHCRRNEHAFQRLNELHVSTDTSPALSF